MLVRLLLFCARVVVVCCEVPLSNCFPLSTFDFANSKKNLEKKTASFLQKKKEESNYPRA